MGPNAFLEMIITVSSISIYHICLLQNTRIIIAKEQQNKLLLFPVRSEKTIFLNELFFTKISTNSERAS